MNVSYSPEYKAWSSMKTRCGNPNNNRWKYYGGRGISVCNEWVNNFSAFFDHIGPRPSPVHSIDRINNDGDYEPGNVKWSTPSEQARNRRKKKNGIPSPCSTLGRVFLIIQSAPMGWTSAKAAKAAGISTSSASNALIGLSGRGLIAKGFIHGMKCVYWTNAATSR